MPGLAFGGIGSKIQEYKRMADAGSITYFMVG
jgi:hypothetical protein